MRWDELADQQCSMSRALSVLGDRWTLLILSDCFLGVRRFDTFQERLGISRTILADRLAHLEENDVLRRVVYQDQPVRHEYRLTDKGLGLHAVILSMVHWGDQYCDDGRGAPVVHRHKKCGYDFTSVLSCSECGEPVAPRHIEARVRKPRRGVLNVMRGPIRER